MIYPSVQTVILVILSELYLLSYIKASSVNSLLAIRFPPFYSFLLVLRLLEYPYSTEPFKLLSGDLFVKLLTFGLILEELELML